MVYLSRIYTKTGDTGETGLGDGTRVTKDHARVTAYGTIDELNAVLGLLLLQLEGTVHADLIRGIQNDLFDAGADLCVPAASDEQPVAGSGDRATMGSRDRATAALRVQASQAKRLEIAIDGLNESLEPLRSFVLPGGTAAAAWCHLARTVCRRAERDVVTLMHKESVNTQVMIYLNRLSDLLFVLARVCNNGGKADVLWVPGKHRQS
jgi:cob(I)alamin adenosyltransferase